LQRGDDLAQLFGHAADYICQIDRIVFYFLDVENDYLCRRIVN
jgi:hypothetical protein